MAAKSSEPTPARPGLAPAKERPHEHPDAEDCDARRDDPRPIEHWKHAALVAGYFEDGNRLNANAAATPASAPTRRIVSPVLAGGSAPPPPPPPPAPRRIVSPVLAGGYAPA